MGSCSSRYASVDGLLKCSNDDGVGFLMEGKQ